MGATISHMEAAPPAAQSQSSGAPPPNVANVINVRRCKRSSRCLHGVVCVAAKAIVILQTLVTLHHPTTVCRLCGPRLGQRMWWTTPGSPRRSSMRSSNGKASVSPSFRMRLTGAACAHARHQMAPHNDLQPTADPSLSSKLTADSLTGLGCPCRSDPEAGHL